MHNKLTSETRLNKFVQISFKTLKCHSQFDINEAFYSTFDPVTVICTRST